MDASPGFRGRRAWILLLLALTAGQGWLTLRLFSAEYSLNALLNDEPILSGEHPLHLYHGSLGARTWRERGTSSCFDPAFQAGYPKTPVFDPGSRPAELFLLAARGSPAAYKVGLALCCLFVPIAFALMGRGIGLTPAASCLAAFLGGVLWWSPPIRALIDGGDLDLLLGGLCVLVNVCWLVRYSADPGIDSWVLIMVSAALGWYVQPLLFVGFLPVALLYYLWIACRHGIAWHLSLSAAAVVAFLVNFSWLDDWFRYLWVRLPFGEDGAALPAKPLKVLLDSWQTLLPRDYLSIGIGLAGLIGMAPLLRRSTGSAAVLLLSSAGFLAAGAAGRVWEPLHELGAEKLLPLVVWCAALPCACLLTSIADHLGKNMEVRALGAVWLVLALTGLAWAIDLPQSWLRQPALAIGFSNERRELMRTLETNTTREGRILFEERTSDAADSGWTALLADRTGRQYVGGLAPRWGVEHMFVRLVDGKLAGRPIGDWSGDELIRFCERYNIGWVAAWSNESKKRFGSLEGFRNLCEVRDGGRGILFGVERNKSFFLRGRGQVIQMDWQRVALADVVPDDDGCVVLSLHHLRGWRIAPNYVIMEPELDALDPVPLVRLRLSGPVARLTLTWENR